jgi:hypothetical protein
MVTISELPAIDLIVESVANKMATTEQERQKLIKVGQAAAIDFCTKEGYGADDLNGPRSFHCKAAIWEVVTTIMTFHAAILKKIAGDLPVPVITRRPAPPSRRGAAA